MGLAQLPGEPDELLDHLRRRDGPVLVLDHGALQHLREAPRLDKVAAQTRLDLVVQELLQQLDGEVAPRHVTHLGEKAVVEHGDVRALEPRDGEDVDDLVARDGARDDLPHGEVELLVALQALDRGLHERRAHRLEEAHVVADRERFLTGHGQRERLAERGDRIHETLLAVVEPKDELLGVADELQLLLVRARGPQKGVLEDHAACRTRPRSFSCITAMACAWSTTGSPLPPPSV